MNSYEKLRVESIWRVNKPDWVDFFLICSGRILFVQPFVLPEIERLPEDAEKIEPAMRDRSDMSKIDYGVPMERIFDDITFVGTECGDDVTILLSNGSAIVYYLESNPQAIFDNKPDQFRCRPVMLFLDPEDIANLDINCCRKDLKLIKVKLCDSGYHRRRTNGDAPF